MCSLDKIFFLSITLIMSISDIRNRSVKAYLIGLNILVGIFFSVINKNHSINYIFFVVFTLLFVIISKVSKEKIGYGDSILIGSLFLFYSIYDVEIILLSAFMIFNLVVFIICLKKRKFKNLSLPFIPFIFISCLIDTIVYIVSNKL